MELHQLRYFLAIVDSGSFTAAAQQVQISQSGISTQLQKLERELGIALIDRSARRVAPTPAGTALVPYARAAIAAVGDVASAANDIRGLITGSLRIGTVTGLAWPRLFDALAELHTAHPGIDIRLREGNSAELITQLREGSAEVGIVAWSDRPPDGLAACLLFDDALVAVVARDHPWAARSRISPAELARADVITLPVGTGARTALDALLARAGAPAQPRWEVTTPSFVAMLTSRGLGVGVVSATTAAGWPDVVALAINDRAARSRLGVLWRAAPSHAAGELLRRLGV